MSRHESTIDRIILETPLVNFLPVPFQLVVRLRSQHRQHLWMSLHVAFPRTLLANHKVQFDLYIAPHLSVTHVRMEWIVTKKHEASPAPESSIMKFLYKILVLAYHLHENDYNCNVNEFKNNFCK